MNENGFNEVTPNLNLMDSSWTGNVMLRNGLVLSIWWTCWPSIKSSVKEVLNVSSDYPRHRIKGFDGGKWQQGTWHKHREDESNGPMEKGKE